ncbi:MAG TPA: DUF2089 family protein [Bryobacteraceae bacterium]|nr:DUF2089 family protein [Bryobacteraceae bacterium]
MIQGWKELTKLTAGAAFFVERARLVETGVAIEGQFEPPPLAQLAEEDQIFVAAFVRCHGSIKQMEKFFGVSYPTIKNRLNRVGELLPFAEIETADDEEGEKEGGTGAPPAVQGDANSRDLLTSLERGEMSVQQVLARLKKTKGDAK